MNQYPNVKRIRPDRSLLTNTIEVEISEHYPDGYTLLVEGCGREAALKIAENEIDHETITVEHVYVHDHQLMQGKTWISVRGLWSIEYVESLFLSMLETKPVVKVEHEYSPERLNRLTEKAKFVGSPTLERMLRQAIREKSLSFETIWLLINMAYNTSYQTASEEDASEMIDRLFPVVNTPCPIKPRTIGEIPFSQ